MTDMRRFVSVATLAAAAFLAGCDDGLIRPAAQSSPAVVAIAASLDMNLGGVNEAYQKVNQLSVRFLAGSEVRLTEVVPFDPSASRTVVSLQVPLNQAVETFTVQLDLLASSQRLFTGSGTAQLSSGSASQVQIPILPVVSGVSCAGSPFQIRVYQAARRITAAALFASGDTVPDVAVGWSTSNAGIVTVSQSGDLIALQDGSAQVTCSIQGFTSTRQVDVLAAVASVQVAPALDTAVVGTSVPFTAAFKDSLAHPILTPRATTWASGNNSIATVNAAGVATAVAPGLVTITASSGGASGNASLLVLTLPAVTTLAASSVAASTATLNGTVNPQGLTTQAWFEFGTAADLAGAASTTPQAVGSGNVAQGLSLQLSNLLANQTYYFRAVASSAGGTVRGNILSFTTLAPPMVRTIGGTPVLTGASLSGGVNPQGLATIAWFEWSTSPSLADAQRTPNQNLAAGRTELPTSGSLSNLSPGVTYYFRAAASNAAGTAYGAIMSLVANGPPVVTTLAASVPGTSATLQGTVNPGGTSTNVWFEWGTSPTLTGATSTAAQNIGAGNTNVAVSAGISGLISQTTYYYRVAATNQVGTTRGSILSFTVPGPPVATTLAPTGITGSQAALQASVNPNGLATSAWFEWSVGRIFTTINSTASQALGSGTGALAFSQVLSGLQPQTTYIYRAAASNAVGTTRGSGIIFTTGGAPLVTTGTVSWEVNPFQDLGYWLMLGNVNPNGEATTAWIEWADGWNDPNFTSPTATPPVSIGSGYTSVPISGTSYTYTSCLLYRAAAQNRFGTRYGTLQAYGCIG